jgi:cold shock CspA family protein
MVDDLLSGRVTSFRREQGFGVITLDDGRDVKFDASDCTMVPEEGATVRLRIGPARWGGGIKALHVEPRGSSTLRVVSPPTMDEQIAALQSEHLVGELSEMVMARLSEDVFGGRIGDAALIDVLDAFYAADPARAHHDGYLRFVPPLPAVGDALAAFATALGTALPRPVARSIDELAPLINRVLEAARDVRRVYPLITGRHWRAYYVLATDRAQRLARVLPFSFT